MRDGDAILAGDVGQHRAAVEGAVDCGSTRLHLNYSDSCGARVSSQEGGKSGRVL
jgi:hypothetical protein